MTRVQVYEESLLFALADDQRETEVMEVELAKFWRRVLMGDFVVR